MAGRNIETLLSYHCLTGPLLKNPVSEYDKAINKLQMKYRTYIVEYDFETKNLKMCVRVAHIWLIPEKKVPTNIIFMNMLLVDAKL
ncbi:hypothetical protein MtrunA17_Chr6g0478391 [Medicago truncatula]|uniref:Uncharacterized protein n=1 Tax=Medicago truncatula TaxID=3880 RepID=A0A396HLQ5_MEDTR|nr:hypothetical protein MtrunA17_Chr6g0478391 [Medicago truncatula]